MTASDWIYTKYEKPDYYRNVTIFCDDGSVLSEWHRLSDGENEYYGSLNTDSIIPSNEVIKWKIN